MKKQYSLKSRALAVVMCIIMVLGMLPVDSIAAEETLEYGKLDMLTSGAVITGNETADIKVSYTEGSVIAWSAADPSIGRYQDGWWAGVKMTAPAGMTKEQAQAARYMSGANEKSFWQYKDSADTADVHYITMWIPLNGLLTNTFSPYEYRFDWNNDGIFEQKVTLEVDPAAITLKDESGNQAFPLPEVGFGKVEMITAGAVVTGSETANAQVNFSEGSTIEWSPADESIGRYQDGWWAGVKVTVPAGMTKEQVQAANYMSGEQKKAFWAYKDSADDADVHFITMWIPLNGLQSGTFVPYTYQFDWNNDGVYEQKVAISADAEAITLNKDGVQVYPALGAVTGYTGGTVSGDQTGKVTIHVANVALNWDPKDTAIGRNEDAWWVGMKVTAPTGMSEDMLQHAIYQSKGSPTGEWSADKRFWDFKDTQPGAAAHYIGMWFPVTPDTLKTFAEEGRMVTMWYRFDWDNDGVFEQEITFSLDPNTVTLNKKEQTDFKFEDASPADAWCGEPYQNKASGTQGDGKVTYEIYSGSDIASVDNNGVVTFTGEGVVVVQAIKAPDSEGFYKEATATYTITAFKKEQTPSFNSSNPTPIVYADGENGENPTFTNPVKGAEGVVSYAITSGDAAVIEDETQPVLTILKAGEVTVTATVSGSNGYKEKVISYTLTILAADQTPTFEYSNPEITYDPNQLNYPNAAASNALNDAYGTVVYEIIDEDINGDVADIDPTTGVLTIKKAGTIVVKANVAGDAAHNAPAEAPTYTLTVLKANQSELSFAETDPEITWNDANRNAYTQLLTGGESTGEYIYEIVDHQDLTGAPLMDGVVAELDSATPGKLMILRSGKVTVKAVKLSDDCYNASEPVYYTLTVERAEQFLSVQDDNVTYGATEYKQDAAEVKVPDAADGVGHGDGEITYTVNANDIGASIKDPTSGKVTFEQSEGKVGFVTVTATRAEDDRYKGCSATYVLKVEYLSAPEKPYTLSGTTLNNSGWYVSTVDICAPEGYEISESNDFDSVWNEKVSITTEGANQSKTVYLKDASGAMTGAISVSGINVDKSVPKDLKISYDKPTWQVILDKITFGIYKAPTLKVTVFATDEISGLKSLTYNLGGEDITVSCNDEKTYKCEFEIEAQYRGQIVLTAMDVAGQTTQLKDDKVVVLDTKEPSLTPQYVFASEAHNVINGVYYTQEDTTIIFTIDEANFDLSGLEIVGEGEKKTEMPIIMVNNMVQQVNWVNVENTSRWEAEIKLSGNGYYDVSASYKDAATNEMEQYQQTVCIDNVVPAEVKITYSTAENTKTIDRILEAITFGFYKQSVQVTLTSKDATAGVDFFTWSYTKEDGTSDKNAASQTGTITAEKITYNADGEAKATFEIRANARGYITASATDKAGNQSADAVDSNTILVVDKIAPAISVTYTADDTATKVQFVDSNYKTVSGFEDAVNAFFNGNVTAHIAINEANFFEGVAAEDGVIHQVGIKLTKTDDDGNVTVYEYLPEGAAQKYEGATPVMLEWEHDQDKHSFSICYDENADYVLEIEYTDLSTNGANIEANDGQKTEAIYISKTVTVDKLLPTVTVEYDNQDVINTIDGRLYFNKTQSATITVIEHNFRASDIKAVVTALGYANNQVDVADFAAQLADPNNWTHNGNVHKASVEYIVDANYTFDIDFMDMAKNEFVGREADLFTVDTTAPTNLTITYSTNVFEEILESITFGYYNAAVKVTVTATDTTSGIHHIAYSYMNGQGVSGVNAELLNQAIQGAEIRHEGSTATAEFFIPKEALGNRNQFNGTVQFTAYDRSENNTELKDNTRLVVDNISPTATISYNEPVKIANGTSFYAGNINATIVIDEANFDADDVIVSVTKDGRSYPVNVAWRNNSVDTHTGSFALTEDGDYIVSVQYKDKSGNEMNSYTSNELTLDATSPVITVSNIKANTANKDEKYGFVIEISDTNLDVSTMKPILMAVLKNDDGVYQTVEIDLGEPVAVVDGQKYTYTVENLAEDALYTLACGVKDMSDNEMKQVVLEDGKSYDWVQFSVNRKGSTFGYGTPFTEKLVNQYYVYSVMDDLVIVEVNVDPIENYTVTLNGKTLVEGTDYITTQTSKSGEWSKRTYTIKRELFVAEGEYSVIVSSTDKTNTTAFSDVKNLTVAFTVDQTKPVLTITGLEAGGRYQTDLQTVTLMPNDEGGRLNSLKVVVLDSNGDPLKDDNGKDISVRFEMSGEELLKYLSDNSGKITFTIPEGLNNQVQIICNDCAINAENQTNTYDELFKRVTVSRNKLVIFYANTPLFLGSLAGVAAVIALIIVLVKRSKNKKTKA